MQCVSFDIWLKVYFQGYSLTIEKNGNIAQETENVSHKHQVLVVILMWKAVKIKHLSKACQ